jgi:2-polyprenyl-3-methyl-5-hydroxy-6-metoxy-1,4-benzoquinol methylase
MLQKIHKYKMFVGLHIPDHVFEDIYATSSDPYGYTFRDYERQKRSVTLAALSRDRYMNAFEIGCSIGVLTRLLGERCDTLLSVDIVERALQQAKQRCAAERNVRFARMRVPDEWPNESFDLIVISEVCYYLTVSEIERLVQRLRSSLRASGEIILVHSRWTGMLLPKWLQRSIPVLSRANRIHDRVIALTSDFARVIDHRQHNGYRLDLLRRIDHNHTGMISSNL